MNQKDLISVIIPVYNVEKYLKRCIDSVLQQTYKELEIILIDDGSTDNCGLICDEYKVIDERIKVIHKKNGGVSDARNAGLEKCVGNYICFIDSDDYVVNDYIEYLYKILKNNNAEISSCNFEYVYETTKNVKIIDEHEKIYKYDRLTALRELLYQKNVDNSFWGKLFKKELFENIKFPYGKIYEDFAIFYKILLKSNLLVYSNLKKYLYLQREKSILSTPFGEKDLYMITVSKEMYNEIIKEYPTLDGALNSRILNMDFYLLRRMNKKYYLKEYQYLVNDIKKRRGIVRKDKEIKLKTKIAIYISYINIDSVKIFYNLAKKIKILGISKYLTKYKK